MAATDGAAAEKPQNKLISQFLGEVDQQLEQLRPAHEEFMELAAFRNKLTSDNGSAPAAPVARRRSTGPRSTQVSDGSVKDQLLKLIQSHPDGISVSEAAAALGKQNNYLYRIRGELIGEGAIRKDGTKMFPMDETSLIAARTRELEAAAR